MALLSRSRDWRLIYRPEIFFRKTQTIKLLTSSANLKKNKQANNKKQKKIIGYF